MIWSLPRPLPPQPYTHQHSPPPHPSPPPHSSSTSQAPTPHSAPASPSCGSQNGAPHTGQPQTTAIQLLRVQGAGSPQSRSRQGWFLREALREDLLQASPPFLVAAAALGIPRPEGTSLQLLCPCPHSLPLSVVLCFSLKREASLGLGPTLCPG